jgi:hypothetical protein
MGTQGGRRDVSRAGLNPGRQTPPAEPKRSSESRGDPSSTSRSSPRQEIS